MLQIITKSGITFDVTPKFLNDTLVHNKELSEVYVEANYPCTCSINESNSFCDGSCVPDEVWDNDFEIKEIVEVQSTDKVE